MKSQPRILLWTTGLTALVLICIFGILSVAASEPAVSPVYATMAVPGPVEGGTSDQSGSSRLEAPTGERATEPPSPDAALESAAESIEFGFVVGTIFDYDGEPIPRGMILFERSGPGMGTEMADDEGQYRISLPTGIWIAYYLGRPHTDEGGWMAMGTVEVRANQDVYLDFYLLGNRKLIGGFRRSDMDMVLLEVEVRDLRDPERVVAKTLCGTNNAEHAAWLEALEIEDLGALEFEDDLGALEFEDDLEALEFEDDLGALEFEDDLEALEFDNHGMPPPALSQGVGRFELEALPPAYYEIRVYMDIGKRFYVRAEVDLTDADFEFEPVSLEEADFLGRKTLDL
jgi:hypothetical protein